MSLKPNESPEARPRTAAARRLLSRDLLGGAQEVVLAPAGDFYRLLCTSNGNLILTTRVAAGPPRAPRFFRTFPTSPYRPHPAPHISPTPNPALRTHSQTLSLS